MPKRKLILLTLASLLVITSFSFCFAADSSSSNAGLTDQIINFWNTVLRPAGHDLVIWFNNDIRPWVDQQMTPQAKDQFRQVLKQVLGDIPGTIRSVIDGIGNLFK